MPAQPDVRVWYRKHPFREEREFLMAPAGISVRRLLRSLLKIPSELTAKIFINGNPASLGSKLNSGDLVNVTVVPRGFLINGGWGADGSNPFIPTSAATPILDSTWSADGSSPFIPSGSGITPISPQQPSIWQRLLGGIGGAGLLGVSLLLSRIGRDSSNQNSVLSNPVAQTSPIETPDPIPILDFGGEAARIQPQVTSIANQKILFGKIPYLAGTFKMYPPKSANDYTVEEGSDQNLYACFDIGAGEHVFNEQKIGEKSIEEIVGAEYQNRLGLDSDEPISLYTNDVEQTSLNIALGYNVPQIKRAGQPADKLSIDIQFDQGLYYIGTNTNPDTGQVTQFNGTFSVQFKIEYRQINDSGSWTDAGTFTLSDATTSTVRKNISIEVDREHYDVRVTRLTPDYAAPTYVDDSSWVVLRAILFEDPFKPIKDSNGNEIKIARTALKVTASDETSGALAQYNLIPSRKLRSWNGSTWDDPAVSSNHSDIALDILQGAQNPLPVPDASIDLPAFLAWRNWLIANGFSFNHIFDQETTVKDALDTIAGAGRAQIFVKDSKFTVVYDAEKAQLVQHFTPRNTWGFKAEKTFYDAPHYLRVRFINPDADWQTDERFVYDDGYEANNATKHETIDLIGCTDADLAWKQGRYHIAQRRLRPEIFEFNVDIENLVCNVGDLVRFSHDVPRFGSGFGRIKSVTTNGSGDITHLRLDTKVTFISGDHCIRIRLSDGSSSLHDVQLHGGETDTLTLVTPILAATDPKPAAGDLAQFGLKELESVELIITKIEHQESLTALIQAVEHAPAVHQADQGEIPAFQTKQTFVHPALQLPPQPVIIGARSDEAVLRANIDGSLDAMIQLTMANKPASNVQWYQYQYKLSDADWKDAGIQAVPASSGEINIGPLVEAATYDVRIRCVDDRNRVSLWNSSISNHLVIGKTTPPPLVKFFEINGGDLVWYADGQHDFIKPRDFKGFRLKMNWGDDENWTHATVLADLITGTRFNISGLAKGLKTFLLKSVDVAENESTDAAIIKADFGGIDVQNVVLTENHHPLFAQGASTNMTVEDEKLKADDNGDLIWTGQPSARIWTGNPSALIWSISYAKGIYAWSYTPKADVEPPGRLYLSADITSDHKIEYTTPLAVLWWSGNPSKLIWSCDSSRLIWGQNAPPYAPFPTNGIDAKIQRYDFKITTFAGDTQGIINTLAVVQDVPDIEEYIQAVISPGSNRLSLTKTFLGITHVQISLLADLTNYPDADRVEIIEEDSEIQAALGPKLKVKDSGGVETSGKVYALVRGYGR